MLGPNITGSIFFKTVRSVDLEVVSQQNNAFYLTTKQYNWENGVAQSPNDCNIVNIDASRSSSVYGKYNTVQPPSLVLNYMIKY